MCLEGWLDGGDDAIEDLVRTAGVCLARTQLGASTLRHGNAKLVGDGAAACLPLGIGLAREHGEDYPTNTLLSPSRLRSFKYWLIGTTRNALKATTRSISF